MSLDNYILLVLKYLNLQPTANRVNLLRAWAAEENTKAVNNYFATTWNAEPNRADRYIGGYWFNWNGGFPVKNYTTPEIGARAFAYTLLYGNYYPGILAGLVSGGPLETWYNSQIEREYATYGGSGYGNKVLNLWAAYKDKNAPGNNMAGFGLIPALLLVGIFLGNKQN
jgi:hypothetical protein